MQYCGNSGVLDTALKCCAESLSTAIVMLLLCFVLFGLYRHFLVGHVRLIDPYCWGCFTGTATTIPANTQRNKHVTITSKQRFDMIIMCLLRYVLAEIYYCLCHSEVIL